MRQLPEKLKKYVLIGYDGSRTFVSDELGKKVIMLKGNHTTSKDSILIKDLGTGIDLPSISKVMPIEEFYNQYPKERPETVSTSQNNFNKLPPPSPMAREKFLRKSLSILEKKIKLMGGLHKCNDFTQTMYKSIKKKLGEKNEKEKRFCEGENCKNELPLHIDKYCSGKCAGYK